MKSGSHFFQFCDIKDMVSFSKKLPSIGDFTLKKHISPHLKTWQKFIGKKFTI
jgi:hypothetical protein